MININLNFIDYKISILIIIFICITILYFINYNPFHNTIWYNIGKDNSKIDNKKYKEIYNQDFKNFFNNKNKIGDNYKFTKDQYKEVNLTYLTNYHYIKNNDGYYFINNNENSKLAYIFDVLLIIISIFIIFNLYIQKQSNFRNNLSIIYKSFKYICKISFFILLPTLLLYTFIILNINNNKQYGIYKILLILTITIFSLAIIYSLFSKYIKRCYNEYTENILQKIVCSIIYFTFSLPCLLLIVFDEFKKQLKITLPITYILLLAELITILLILFLYNTFNNLNNNNYINNGDLIQLHKNYNNFNKDFNNYLEYNKITRRNNNINNTKQYNIPLLTGDYKYNLNIHNNFDRKKLLDNINKFTISFNIYIKANDNLGSNDYIEFFNFFNTPSIEFNNINKQLIFKLDTKDKYETSNFKLQTYNLVKIEYQDTHINISINNNLKYSQSIKLNPDFTNLSNNLIGTDNKLYGNIKDLYIELSIK